MLYRIGRAVLAWRRLAAGIALLGLLAVSAAQAQDSCIHALDGECDEPTLCEPGTDTQDCRAAPRTRDPFQASASPPRESVGPAEAGASTVLAVLVLAAALFTWLKDLAPPRSGFAALAVGLMGLALVVHQWLPDAVLAPMYELAAALGIALQTVLLLVGAALLVYVLYLNRRGATAAATGGVRDLAAIAPSPDVRMGEGNEITAARHQCQYLADTLERRLAGEGGDFRLYAQHDHSSQPWLKVERASSDAHGTYLTQLRMDFKPQPFGTLPVLVDLEVDHLGRTRRVTSVCELGDAQVQILVDALTGRSPRFVWRGTRMREWPWQWQRPKQRTQILESPFSASFRANVKLALAIGAAALAFAAWTAAPEATVVLVAAAGLAWWRWWPRRPVYRMVAECPQRPPRALRGLDSWQAVIRDLGAQRDAVVERFEQLLSARMGDASEPVSIRRENIWYSGATGKVERQQLSISLRRAVVFVRIYRYGSDLFVGWDAHVNQLSFKDVPVHTGHRASDGRKVQLVGMQPESHPVNEYDITDANFLLEATHAHLTALLRTVMREHEIDQELDFSIVRESRQGLVAQGQPATPRRRLFRPA